MSRPGGAVWVVLLVAIVIGPLPAAAVLVGALDPAAWAELAQPLLWERLGRSLMIVAAVLVLAVPLGLVLAWLLVRTDLPLRRPLLVVAMVPLFLPPLIHALSWLAITRLRGLPAILVVYLISYLPFVVLLATRALRQVSRAHAESLALVGGTGAVVRDDLRQALPAALVGGGFAAVLLLSDFAVADYLTSVGPKVTVYADSLFALHQRGETAAAAAAAVPGIVMALILLTLALRTWRRLGASVGARFEPALPVPLGRWRLPLLALILLIVGMGSLLPLVALVWGTGSWMTLLAQIEQAWPTLLRTLGLAASAATLMVALALPLAWLAHGLRRPWPVDALLIVPLALPALLYGIGLIRVWNRPLLDLVYLGAPILVMAMAGRCLAFVYLPLGGALERLGPGLLEAAELAGAGMIERLRLVLLPLLAAPLITAWIIGYGFALREIDTLVMLRAGHDTLLYRLHRNIVFAPDEEVAALALLTLLVSMAPLLIWALATPASWRWLRSWDARTKLDRGGSAG